MSHRFAEITFTDSVKATQDKFGSREQNHMLEMRGGPNARLGSTEIDFIRQRDAFYMATVSETDWPYVQHRGGPSGFLKVIGPQQLAYADFRGNTQLISMGNVTVNDRCALILMDYPNRRRLKILGHMRVVDAKDALEVVMQKVSLDKYPAQIERVVFIEVEAFDWNCPQHIMPRYTIEEFNQIRQGELK